jgi:hypothetical protein
MPKFFRVSTEKFEPRRENLPGESIIRVLRAAAAATAAVTVTLTMIFLVSFFESTELIKLMKWENKFQNHFVSTCSRSSSYISKNSATILSFFFLLISPARLTPFNLYFFNQPLYLLSVVFSFFITNFPAFVKYLLCPIISFRRVIGLIPGVVNDLRRYHDICE